MFKLNKGILFFIWSVTACCFFSLLFFDTPYSSKNNKKTKTEGKIPLRDRMDLAMEQEFELTKDPATNTVPRERLVAAGAYMALLQSQAVSGRLAGAIPGINWQERGPNNFGGRTRTIMVDPNDATKRTVWAGGVAGGIWKTTDITQAAPNWTAVNDFFTSIAITSVCYAPSNTQIFYFGTGEGYFNGDYQRGNGIWKSTDGGTTWNQLTSTNANANFHYVNRMVVNNNGDVYAATISGVFRSQDGGTTWVRVLSSSSGSVTSEFSDIEVASDNQVWASTRSSGAIYKSPTGNLGSWTLLNTGTNGFPATGVATRIDIALAPSNANVCYAFAAHGGVNFYKTTDGGANWTLLTKPVDADGGIGSDITRTQFWYDMSIAVDPLNDAVVFVGGVDLFKSSNSGSTWQQISHWYGGFGFQEVHADQHIAIFEPGNSNVIYFGNDGGIYRSGNATAVIPVIDSKHDNYNITQFYACAIHPAAYSNYFLAGAQDNGSHQFTFGGIGATNEVTGGDGCFVHIDQNEPQFQFTSYVRSNYYRSTDGGASFSSITNNNNGSFVNPSDYDNAANNFYASYTSGSYSRILNAPAANTITTVAIAAFGGTVTHVSCSQNTANKVFFGLNNGRVVRVDNADQAVPAATQINSGAGMPGSSVSCIAIENGNDNHLLVTYSSYGVNSVWETINGGTSWTSVEGNIPDMPVRAALFNPNNNQQVIVGTELGVWSTDLLNGVSTNWAPSNTGLANTRVTMLQIRTSDKMVIASTHGRGLFSSDIFTDPNPDFLANKIIAYINKPINFIDASFKSTSWNWDFGDGGNAVSKNAVYAYASPGLYTVSLQINGSLTATKNAYIQVLPNRGTPYIPAVGGSFDVSATDFGAETVSGTPFQRGSSAVAAKSGTNSGGNAWVTGISASSYAANTEAKLYTPNYNLSTPGSYTLSFYKKNLFETDWDGFRIEYSLNKGDDWTILGGVAAGWYDFANSVQTTAFPLNQPYFNSASASFSLRSLDISFLAGNPNVAFRYVFKSDGSVNSAGVAVDDFQISGPSNDPLPVELLSFNGKAKNNLNELNWVTASELNNYGFELERTESGFEWEKIGFVNGAGNSVTTQVYSFEDKNIVADLYYYRLKQIDFNGKIAYSRTISISKASNTMLVVNKLFPNPFYSSISIEFSKQMEDELQIILFNLNGNIVFSKVYPPQKSVYFIELLAADLPSGTYILKAICEKKYYIKKLSKL